jgi:hypothetical protein
MIPKIKSNTIKVVAIARPEVWVFTAGSTPSELMVGLLVGVKLCIGVEASLAKEIVEEKL